MLKIKLFVCCVGTAVFTGCNSPRREPLYLMSSCTGFIQGPVIIKDGVPIRLGSDEYYLAHPTAEELAVLSKLRTKRVQIRAWDVDIAEFITALNDAQSKQGDGKNTVNIMLFIPLSWDTPITYSDEDARSMGYDKGFSTSGRAEMPPVKIVTDGDVPVYDILQSLQNSWGVQFHFKISGYNVVLQVVDYRGVFREYYPPVVKHNNAGTPSQTRRQDVEEAVVFPH